MTDLSRLGEELRTELGEPPASFTDRQRLRLRGLDLSPPPNRRPQLLVAALAAAVLLVGGTYFWPGDEPTPQVQATQKTESGASESDINLGNESDALWVEAQSASTTHRLRDGSFIELAPGARGRLDQRNNEGIRFDLHEGTATFEVREQTGMGFSVVAGQYRVVVVGTRFTTAYVPPEQLSVAVEEGTVQVYLPNRSDPVSVSKDENLEIEGRKFSLHSQGEEPSATSDRLVDVPPDAQVSGTGRVSWRQLFREGKYEPACQAARSQSIAELRGQLDAAGLTDLAGALRLCGDAKGALGILQSLRTRYPGSSHAHDALFTIGRIHATGGQSQAAISNLRQYLEGGGSGRFAAEALGRLIELHKASGNRQEAKRYALRYLQVAPQGPYRKLAESAAEAP